MIYLDSATKYLDINLYINKSEVANLFKEYILKSDPQNSNKIKIIKTDNGTEYNNLNNFCKEKGIIRECLAPYIYKQQDSAERINLTLLNKIAALLFNNKLHLYF